LENDPHCRASRPSGPSGDGRYALDFAGARAEKQYGVSLSPQLYAVWRTHRGSAWALHDAPEGTPAERLLQQVWLHQRLRRDQLSTLDGQSVTVLHPGFWNREAGPDFRRAVLQIGTGPARSGDVEIDLMPGAWRGHGHDRNPAYRGVILHVVWDADPQTAWGLPTLRLCPHLDAPLEELGEWMSSGLELPAAMAGRCAAPFCGLPDGVRQELLRQAALTRFRRKAGELAARARQAGWEQALWEGVFGALGYKRNVWPMRRLAELLPRLAPERPATQTILLEARLLGVAGLLPAELPPDRASAAGFLRRLWDVWWRERGACADILLPPAAWQRGGLRPANQPKRRLALAARWLSQPGWVDRLEAWFRNDVPARQLAPSLLETLEVAPDDFWSWHWTLRSDRLEAPEPLLGAPRATDLAVNVILPWFWVRARAGGTEGLQRRAEHRFLTWPKAQDNVILRLARQRLLTGGSARSFPGAARQQGLLQIVGDFCDQTNALCEGCRFPDLVRTLTG
jgi:hypothetical protein